MRGTVQRAAVLVTASIAFSVPGCRESGPDSSVPYFTVQTFETIVVNGFPTITAFSVSITGQHLNDAPGDPVNYLGIRLFTQFTSYRGFYTVNNARIPAYWRFQANTGGCAGKYYEYPHPTDPFAPKLNYIVVNNRDSFRLSCVPDVSRTANLATHTVDAEGNIIPKTCCFTDTLSAGQELHLNESITSSDGRFAAIYQGDGNMVVYDMGLNALWSSGTWGTPYNRAAMQTDGNFVLYDADGVPVWYTGTAGNPGAFLRMQNDGNLVVFNGSGSPIWSSGPCCGSPPGGSGASTLSAGQSLYPGSVLTSPNGRFALTYQTDGNLVLYDYGWAVWAINCWPTCSGPYSAGVTTMQTDGNFVVYDAVGTPIWHTQSNGNPGAYLAVYDDGGLIVHAPGGAVLWSR